MRELDSEEELLRWILYRSGEEIRIGTQPVDIRKHLTDEFEEELRCMLEEGDER